MKTAYPDTLNALCAMRGSLAYAMRRKVLADAEQIIVAQEQQIEALHAQLASFRAVACMSTDELARWKEGNALIISRTAPPSGGGEWHTLYVKD